MKNQDTTTSALCYCRDATNLKTSAPKAEQTKPSTRNTIRNLNTEREEPWSVFGEWYWI